MQRLRGSDAFAIYSETPTSPFVTVKVVLYEPTDKAHPPSAEELKHFFERTIENMGLARTALRIVPVPLNLHHPVWLVDPAFSLQDHLYHVSLPAPGGKAELCDFVSDLLGMPMNPNRPMWEIWLLDGLENGRIAAVLKIHHALADGKMVARLLQRIHSEEGLKKAPLVNLQHENRGEAIPGPLKLIVCALADLLKSYTVELPHYYRYLKQAREGSAAIKSIAEESGLANEKHLAPWTILNQPTQPAGQYRLYRYQTFSLPRFKTLGRVFNSKLNPLILAVCSEALKRYLDEYGCLPSSSLTTAMPVGDQAASSPSTLLGCGIQNNNLAVGIVPLFQNIDDFAVRLEAIKRSSYAAIDSVKRSNGRRFDNFLDFMPGTFVRMLHSYILRRSQTYKSPPTNLVISNVPGPRETLYACDGKLKMVELLSVGNLTDAGNMNITVWSYVDKLSFSFYFRKGALPNPDRLVEHLQDVVTELEQQYLSPETGQTARPETVMAAQVEAIK